jgi:ABC-type branched-subunit amino acid transport system substrate-binding protein
MKLRILATVLAALALAVGASACGSSGSSSSSSSSAGKSSGPTGSTLTVADVAPFSGPDAALGPTYLATCYGATTAINNNGGVLGHKLACKSVDTRGDPADAVPAVNQLFATTSGLGRAGHQQSQHGDVLHDRAVGVRPRALPVLLPAGPP